MKSKKDILNSTDPSPATSTASSFIGDNDSETSKASIKKEKVLKRCQSDSSTTSEDQKSRFSSVDNLNSGKTNQLLKLSLFNSSPRSPLHSSSRTALDGSLTDSVYLEAKMLSEKLSSLNNMPIEDLNNISQHLIDTSNISLADADLEQLRISFLENNPDAANKSPNKSEKTETIQEKLTRIKKENVCDKEVNPEVIEIKQEKVEQPLSPIKPTISKSEKEVDDIFQTIKSLMKQNKKDEAKKHLNKLSELLGSSEPKSFLEVQPMVRQDTFEIDPSTGRRKYNNNCNDNDSSKSDENDISTNGDLMEQIAKLFGAQSLDVGSLNLSGNNETKLVVIVPQINTPAATPVKQGTSSRRSVSFSSQRPSTTLKVLENKKLTTPMKASSTLKQNAVRRSSFTAPRQVNKGPSPYDQKLSMGAVRKSLMISMDKSPGKPVSPRKPPSSSRQPSASNVRRSISLNQKIPSLKISEASPSKNRPASMIAPKVPPLNAARSQSVTSQRRPATTGVKNAVGANRPVTRKTEFKAPAAKSRITSSARESLV